MLMQSCIGEEVFFFRTPLKSFSLGFLVHRTANFKYNGREVESCLLVILIWSTCTNELHAKFIIQLTCQWKGMESYEHKVVFVHTHGFHHQICPRACIRTCTIWGAYDGTRGTCWVLVSFIELLMDLSWSVGVVSN